MRSWLGVCALIVGCGRIGFAPTRDAAGAAGQDATTGASIDSGGGIVGDALTTSPGCGSTVVLADDFEDGTIAPIWTPYSGFNTGVSETGGVEDMIFINNVPGNNAAGYRQAARIDLAGACIVAELVGTPNTAVAAVAYLRAGNGTTWLEMFEQGGSLSAMYFNGVTYSGTTRAYVAGQDRFLRMRDVAGVWQLETSPDGITYGLVTTSQPAGFDTTNSYIELGGRTTSPAMNGGDAKWDNVLVALP